jgi:hypothetical protein
MVRNPENPVHPTEKVARHEYKTSDFRLAG